MTQICYDYVYKKRAASKTPTKQENNAHGSSKAKGEEGARRRARLKQRDDFRHRTVFRGGHVERQGRDLSWASKKKARMIKAMQPAMTFVLR